jgi:predicted peptidase
MKRCSLLVAGAVALACLWPSVCRAEEAKKVGFVDRVHKDADGKEIKYVLFVPADYKGDKPYPVILFLHGAGETKGGTKMPVEVGIGTAIKKQEKTFPFITIIPQAQQRGWGADGAEGKRAIAILDEVMKEYKTDPKRVYLTGLSMGGAGTWSLATKYPERWAAIVPICGGGDATKAAAIKDIPCWCFWGDKDAPAVASMPKMVTAIKDAGGNAKFTVYPGVGHNSWDMAYDTKELFDWLLMQSKK